MKWDTHTHAILPNRVLYLEDNPVDADLLRRALARQAPQITLDVVSSISDAMQRVAPDTPDYELILSDLRLPDGSGMELLAHVRERRLPIAVVILTGSGDQNSAIAALKAGANDYVAKRADYREHLVPTLAAALARFRSEFARKARMLRVLYAEHNAFDADLTKRHVALHAPQIRLHVVQNGLDVLHALPMTAKAALPYDVVLLDYQLPGINALEIAKILRNERGLDVPVVLVTGHGSEDVVAEALRLGVADYLVKHAGYLTELPAILEHAHRQAQLMHEQAKLRTTAERLRQLLEANPTILYALNFDGKNMSPEWISENITRVYGYSVDECMQPGWWWNGLHPDDRDRVRAERQRLFSEYSLTHEYRFRDKSGAIRWVRDDMRLLFDTAGTPVAVAGSWSDITAGHLASERQQLHAAALSSTRDAVMITDLASRIIYVNSAFTEITGYTESEIVGQDPRVLQSGKHPPDFYKAMWARLQECGQWQGEVWNRRKNADIYPEWLTISAVRDVHENPTHYVAVMTDLTVIKRSEAQLEHLAHYDPLTSLPNRALLRSLLQHALEKAQRLGHQVGVLFLNLDKFKTINDSLGHAAGDQVLLHVTDRLNKRLSGQHLLGRISADEFVVVLESLKGPGEAEDIAIELRNALEVSIVLTDNEEVYTRTSIGISIFPRDGTTAHDLMHHADTAVHRAKEHGGNQIAFYTTELSARALAQLQMEAEAFSVEAKLKNALREGGLQLYYQPVIDFKNGELVGAEALVRLKDNDGEILGPDRFIPIAEASGLIGELGEWVAIEACQQQAAWRRRGLTLSIAINVSPLQFRQRAFAQTLSKIISDTGITPSCLEVEVTESAIMENIDDAVEILSRIKSLGVKVALDDFGTGYSSLSSLTSLPLDKLKIDQSFVRRIGRDQASRSVTETILSLGRSLKLDVQGEGIDSDTALRYLRSHGCKQAQGYWFSRPLPASKFVQWYRNEWSQSHVQARWRKAAGRPRG